MALEVRPQAQRRNLLQTFRAFQAIAETGTTILLPESEAALWDYAAQWFPYSYRTDDHPAVSLIVEVDHKQPAVVIGSLRRPLLFPQTAFELYRRSWEPRGLFASFAGNPSRVRKRVLNRWKRSQHRATQRVISVTWTEKGRRWPVKAWDPSYVSELGRSQFALCPAGDFQWTYRFFEAAAAGAIPIVETDHALYQGFHYVSMKEAVADLDWSTTEAEENYELARSLLTMDLDELTAEILERVERFLD
jgi:hypothetical protein